MLTSLYQNVRLISVKSVGFFFFFFLSFQSFSTHCYSAMIIAFIYFRTIEKHADKLETLYARWKIRAPISTTTEPPADDSGLGNAELALIILGSVVGLLLLLGLCFAIKTRCRYAN